MKLINDTYSYIYTRIDVTLKFHASYKPVLALTDYHTINKSELNLQYIDTYIHMLRYVESRKYTCR